MPNASPSTQKIRAVVDKLSDDDLRSKGPKDLEKAVEKIGLKFSAVRERVNNELARARRMRGIRKGRGRRIAAQYPTDKEHLRQLKLFLEMEGFRERFDSWKTVRKVVEEVVSFINRFGSATDFLGAIEVMVEDEKGKTECE